MKLFLSLIVILTSFTTTTAQVNITADQLLENSIKYHDPKGQLMTSSLTLDLIETRPNGPNRSTTLKIDIQNETFTSLQTRDTLFIDSHYDKGSVKFKVNGQEEIPEQIIKDFRLDEKRFTMMRNYYQYLWLLPIKLKDEGTNVAQEVKNKDFFGKDALEVKVTYDPAVGTDIWYFYFHPTSHAMIGYRFYKNEAANDGEYILLEGETISGSVRLPKERSWYMHKDDKFLGADILDEFWVE